MTNQAMRSNSSFLVLSRSVYTGDANTVTAGQTLPPGCVAGNVTVPLIAGGSNKVAVTCGGNRQRRISQP
jgi:hypothetical protein